MRILTAALLVVLSLAACGGGGGGGGTQLTAAWQSGVFQPAGNFANKCTVPRTGTDPFTHTAYTDRAGTLLDEKRTQALLNPALKQINFSLQSWWITFPFQISKSSVI